MDFHSLSRKELQALCKKNKIPANMTNVAMADALKALTHVDGMEGIAEQFMSPFKPELFTPRPPRTSRRSSGIAIGKTADEMEPFIKISDTPSAATGRKAPRAVPKNNEVESKEIGAYPKDLMGTPATTARRSSARLRSKITIGSQTPMVVKEAAIEENGGRITRTRQSSRRRSELSLAKEKELPSGIEKTKDLLFSDEIQEQKVIVESQLSGLKNIVVEEENGEFSGITVEAETADAAVEKTAVEIEVNSDETVDLTVAIHSENTEEEPTSDAVVEKPAVEIELSLNENVDLTVAVSSETTVNEEGEALVPVAVETLDFGEGSGEILVTPFCYDDEFEEVFNADSGIEDDVDENTGNVEFDELPTEVYDEESIKEISYENDAAIESEEITVGVESGGEFPAIVDEVKDGDAFETTLVESSAALEVEGSLEEISCKNPAAMEFEESPNQDKEEITVEMESSADIPAIVGEVKEGDEIDTPTVALSHISAEAIVETPTSAKQHLVVLQDRLPTSTKKSTIKREKAVDENRAADAADKENIGFSCNSNTILFVGVDNRNAKNKSAAMKHQQKEDQGLTVMSLRKLKLEYKKVLSKKNHDITTDTNKNENTVEVKKRAALTPLKENCMRSGSN